MRNRIGVILSAAAVFVYAGVSCTSVPMDGTEGASVETGVTISVKEPEGYVQTDGLAVLMGRLINTVHYVHEILPEGTSGDAEDGTVPETGPILNVLIGDYAIMACSMADDAVKIVADDKTDGIDAFRNDLSVSMGKMEAVVTGITEEELGENRHIFNPGVKFIRHFGNPFYHMGMKKQSFFPETPTEVVVEPHRLSQHLTFTFSMKLGEGVELREVVAEISGVVERVNLMSGVAEHNDLCRVLLPVEAVAGPHAEGVVKYKAETEVFGLFPAKHPESVVGPGIFWLHVTVEIDGKEKLYHAGVNIREKILKAGLMKETDTGYCTDAESAEINVAELIVVKKDEMEAENDEGIDKWFGLEDIEIEL